MRFRHPCMVLLAATAVIAGCSKHPPPAEDKAVLDSYEAALFMPDPDLNVLVLHAAWLGPEALPPVLKVWPAATTNDVKRIKLARLLEVLAWNGFRTQESTRLLAGMNKDRQVQVRKSAINALFASAADLTQLDKYWEPADANSSHTSNPAVLLKLPFANCRELLAKRGVAIAKKPDGTVEGDPGRTHTPQPAVPQALGPLRKWWNSESDAGLRIYGAIQALRTGDKTAVEPLILVLKPLPEGSKPSQSLDAVRASSLRALQENTGETLTTFEEWEAWLDKSRPKPREVKRPPPEPPPGGSK